MSFVRGSSGPPRGLTGLPRPVAAVVGGGGVYGATQVGVGYALEQHGFVPDLIVGTSVGAFNGAVAAAHPGSAARSLALTWTGLRRREVFPFGLRTFRAGLFADAGLRRLIRRAGLPGRVEDLPVPFVAVATDLATGEQVLLDHGDLESALLASAAIPGVLPPVEWDGRTLIDGGAVAHAPVLAAREAGAASVVVLVTGREALPLRTTALPRRAEAVAARAGLLMMHQQIERDLREVAREIPTVVLPTGVVAWPALWDFSHSRRLIDAALVSASRFLDELVVTGPGLYRREPVAAVPGEAGEAGARSGVSR
ncbi:patatin-like phospholipase family protein [Promicromonospora thailandica]|uniref:NTE family protein n=1 Tax=Promicromonospora thailandica TaxID=765201 RepID=A0A9X2K094_9MICO|nr:patatin-like phospholipase family protein [Promicromonospora thailandica]MCP2266869.1 NTE family protein [Promicromonospora thailandica]